MADNDLTTDEVESAFDSGEPAVEANGDPALDPTLGMEAKAQESSESPKMAAEVGPDPRGEPWIDYYPENLHRKPEDLIERMKEHQDNVRQMLLLKELFKLRTLEEKIHRSYYWNWVKESNSTFANAVRLKQRIKELEKKFNK